MKVLNKRILVKPSYKQETLGNGYQMENDITTNKEIIYGTVVHWDPSIEIAKGSEVYFPKYAGSPMFLAGESYLSISIEDVEVVVEPGDKLYQGDK